MTRPLIVGFLKVRNEIIREGNIYRCVKNLKKFTDTIVACDDASSDGTNKYLKRNVVKDQRILVPYKEQDFRKELFWKQQMMQIVHRLQPYFVWWQDADEELERDGVEKIRQFCEENKTTKFLAWRFHYTQLWRSAAWARTDEGFDEGSYIKLWRWSPDLSFDIVKKTHHAQFPQQFMSYISNPGVIPENPWEVIHWGNFGTNLRWKAIQYYGGLGGVDRHLNFETGSFRAVRLAKPRALAETSVPKPVPFTLAEKKRILSFKNLKALPETFTVVIPTRDRAAYLSRALQSLLDQTYDKWIALVLDDGSKDDTKLAMRGWQDRDPRIFYCRYPAKGAVWVNERGMDMACEFTEWWTRLGSDDYFTPRKLERDAAALRLHKACYGPYRVLRMDRGDVLGETCNKPEQPSTIKEALLGPRGFVVSWACVAARTSLLRQVKHHWKNYCAKGLVRMEDYLVNARMVRFADFVWRGAEIGGELLINPHPNAVNARNLEHDAIWRINPVGASSDAGFTGNEDVLTRKIIAEENEAWAKSPKT